MILTADQLAKAYARNLWILQRQSEGLSNDESFLQPSMRGNCLNWIVGHLAVHRDYVLDLLGQQKLLDDRATARYKRDSAPITGPDPEALPLSALLAALAQGQEQIASALPALSADDLAREVTFGRAMPLGEALFFLYFHDTYRTGQAEPLRQLAGKDDQVL